MAKFSRFDTRNKKRGKHKYQSQERDIKIKKYEKQSRLKINAKLYDEKIIFQNQEAS